MAPKNTTTSGTTEKLRGVTGLRGRQWRGARAVPPHLQAGPYQSTPKRDKAKPAVAPRNILGEHESAASPSTKSSSHVPLSGKKSTPHKPSLGKDPKPHSSPSFIKSPSAKTTKKKKKSSPATKSKKIESVLPKQEISPDGQSTYNGRATPASHPYAVSSPATEPNSARRLRNYSHSLKRSLYAPGSKLRTSSLRRSSASDASFSLSASKATPPSALYASVKDEKISPSKSSEATAALPRRSLGAIDASFARHSLLNTPRLRSSGGGDHNTPFRAQGPKAAQIGPKVKPAQGCSAEQLSLWDKQIKSWLNKSWNLCCLSAMSSFDIQNANLRSAFQKALRNRVSELLPFSVQVELDTVHCFTRNHRVTDAVALTISYFIPREWDLRKSPRQKNQKNIKEKQSEPRRVLYRSLMIRALLRDDQADEAGVCWYPLCFYSGRQKIHQAVEHWLSDTFGACTTVKNLRSTALLWAAGLWYQQSCGAQLSKPVSVSLSYTLEGLSSDGWQQNRQFPSSHRVRHTSFLTLEMPADQMRNVALCVLPESDEEFVTKDERDLFHGVVQQLVSNVTCLPKQALRLLCVKTSCVALARNGQVRVSCKRHFLGLLQWLLELHREDSLLEQVTDVDYLSQDLDDEGFKDIDQK